MTSIEYSFSAIKRTSMLLIIFWSEISPLVYNQEDAITSIVILDPIKLRIQVEV